MSPNCCPSGDYEEVFTSRNAKGRADRFRRRGLNGSARTIVETLSDLGPDEMSLLEVGGGLGEIQVALLEKGAASSAVNVDLSATWETEAAGLLSERGLTDRVTRITGDFVREAGSLPNADAVILHRVVCCYPDLRAMLTAAVSRANRLVAVTFPRPAVWFKAMLVVENSVHRLRRRDFRAFIHPPDAMIGFLNSSGFPVVSDHHDFVWRTVVAERTAS
jgi:magnesium-protoporphyrin O-methyltransferase